MKHKILNALKNKYKNLGLGEKAFEGVADYLTTTVTEESQIETAIGGVEPMLKALQSEADKLRGENTALKTQLEAAKKPDDKKKPDETQKPDETKTTGDETPAWAKAISDSFKAIQAKLDTLEADKVTGSRRTKLDDHLKDAPDSLKNMVAKKFGKMKFDSDAEFDEYLTEVSSQVEELSKEMKIEGVSANGKPNRSVGGAQPKEATKEESDAVMSKLSI